MTISRFNRRLLPLVALTVIPACQEAGADGLSVPSGREITLIDIITDVDGPQGPTARFRFLAPDLTNDDAQTALADIQALCDSFALPQIGNILPQAEQIVVSLSSQVVPFGQPAPDVVQFFEAFRPENGTCQWEQF